MGLVESAYNELLPDTVHEFTCTLSYSAKFSAYNANVKQRGKHIHFNLSAQWKEVSEEIQIGLIQSLLAKIFKVKTSTTCMDLYHLFLKNVHISVAKDKTDPELETSFNRVNEKYFLGLIDQPNLTWGSESFRKLGSYSYGNDTITMSTIFQNISPEEEYFLDYVMYHELLHKIHKFDVKGNKSYYHTKIFRNAEAQFDEKDIEQKLGQFVRKKKRHQFFGKFFLACTYSISLYLLS